MKILVTGATGFVGSHLCELLNKNGHELFCLVRNTQKAHDFNLPGLYVKGDLHPTRVLSWINELPSDLDVVIHTAGIVHASNANDFFEYNSGATKNLINSLKQKYEKLHFTYISSLAAAGPSINAELINEERSPIPVSDYGKSKLDGELHLKTISDWTHTIIRPPMVIGPRDPAVLDIFKMVKSRFIIGPGLNFKEKKYSFINVFDLVSAIAKTSQDKVHDVFFISNPQIVTFNELISTINDEDKKLFFIPVAHKLLNFISKLLKVIPVSGRLTTDKIKELTQNNWICDGSKYEKILNEKYNYNLKDTVAMTKKDYQERRWL